MFSWLLMVAGRRTPSSAVFRRFVVGRGSTFVPLAGPGTLFDRCPVFMWPVLTWVSSSGPLPPILFRSDMCFLFYLNAALSFDISFVFFAGSSALALTATWDCVA